MSSLPELRLKPREERRLRRRAVGSARLEGDRLEVEFVGTAREG